MILIRIAVSITMVLFGTEQFLKPDEWTMYIPEKVKNNFPINDRRIIKLHSLGNLLIGIWFLIGIEHRLASFITLLWWITILPFAFRYNWKIGMRDLVITTSLFIYVLTL